MKRSVMHSKVHADKENEGGYDWLSDLIAILAATLLVGALLLVGDFWIDAQIGR